MAVANVEVGDVVRLKSGSELMTVSGFLVENGLALCLWYDKGEIKEKAIHPDALEKDK